jgi:hypothetical protein
MSPRSYSAPRDIDLGGGMHARPGLCNGCGATVLWVQVKKADGTTGAVPLDPRAVIYRVAGFTVNGGTGFVDHLKVEKQDRDVDQLTGRCYVSHFNTCPKASEFSRRRKPNGGATVPRSEGGSA